MKLIILSQNLSGKEGLILLMYQKDWMLGENKLECTPKSGQVVKKLSI